MGDVKPWNESLASFHALAAPWPDKVRRPPAPCFDGGTIECGPGIILNEPTPERPNSCRDPEMVSGVNALW